VKRWTHFTKESRLLEVRSQLARRKIV
jgi:hypothetical protein